ncbi:MAG TPA: glycosyltransferase [Gemmatimonadaceae bacterium]|jgi:cellulose synthase/poly-beta-1,6-N-acetylglucosamine synthase-like glycosyltransferase
MLPARSTTQSNFRFRWWDYPAFIALTALHVWVLLAIVYPWIRDTEWTRLPVVLVLLVGSFLLELGIWESRWFALPLMRVPREKAPPEGLRVGVAVTFVPGSESIDMLEKTVRAIVAMRYPHDTWVLDEGDEPRVRQLCESAGARHFSRLSMPQYHAAEGKFKSHTKYGNYNSWLEETGYDSYDFVVAFDSDHVPEADYLDRVLGYFDDELVAYVQPVQAYYNQKASFVAQAAAEETYAYYSSVQMTTHAIGYPIIVGCHNTHRVAALKDIGGFAEHEADDMVMTLLYRTSGWRGVYVPQILARGLTPVDWSGYLKQQRRWARSVLDFKMRVFPKYAKQLPLLERILTYAHGVYYLRGISTALRLAMLVLLLAASFVPGSNGGAFLRASLALWASIALCDLYRQRFFVDPKTEVGIHWRSAFVAFVKWPCFVLALRDAIRRDYGAYTITPKARQSAPPLGFAAVQAGVAVIVGVAWLINFVRGPSAFVPIHLAAGFVVATALLAGITALWKFPPGYDRRAHAPRRRRVPMVVIRPSAVQLIPKLTARAVLRRARRSELPIGNVGIVSR